MTYRERSQSIGWNRYGTVEVSFDGGLNWSIHHNNFGEPTMTGTRSRYQFMADYTDRPPYPNHPLMSKTYTARPMRLDGTTVVSHTGAKWRYTERATYNQCEPFPYVPEPTIPFEAARLITMAMANVNPSKPYLDVPLFVFEFKDFPRMLKNLGDILNGSTKPSTANDAYLAWSFGWAPLIGDLQKLMNIQKAIEDRRKFLQKYTQGSERIGRKLMSQSVTNGGTVSGFWASPDFQIMNVSVDDTETVDAWFTGSLQLFMELPPTFAARHSQAMQNALGGGFNAGTAWNMIPWSFLIDYFSNMGQFLTAIGGTIPYMLRDVCVMQKNVRTRKLTPLPATVNGVSATHGSQSCEVKWRAVSILPTPMLVPRAFLPGSALSNIAALATAASMR